MAGVPYFVEERRDTSRIKFVIVETVSDLAINPVQQKDVARPRYRIYDLQNLSDGVANPVNLRGVNNNAVYPPCSTGVAV